MTRNDDHDPRIASWLESQAPGPLDDAVFRAITERTRTMPQRGRGWAAALVASVPLIVTTGALVLLAVLVTVVDERGGDGRAVGSGGLESSAPSRPSPSVSAGPSSLPSPGVAWTAFALPDPRPEEIQGEVPYDVVAGGPGFVAVGRSYAVGEGPWDESQETPAIWTSVDGATWELAENLAALGPAELRAVAAGPDGQLLAVGFDRRGIGPDEEAPTGVGMWRSADGVIWEVGPVPVDDGSFYDVIATDAEWVVAGHRTPFGGPSIFTSDDLERWTITPLPADPEDELDGLFGNADGRVLAYGCDRPVDDGITDNFGCADPLGWLRTDTGWEAVQLPIVPTIGAVLDDRYVIVGQGEAGAESFVSADGRTWEAGAALPGEAYIASITVTADGVVAAGSIHVGDERFLPAAWLSPDGGQWGDAEILPVEGPPNEPTVTAIIQTPAGLVGLGYVYEGKPVAVGWIRR